MLATVIAGSFFLFYRPEDFLGTSDGAIVFGGLISAGFTVLCYCLCIFWLPNHILVDWQNTVPPCKERRLSKAFKKPSQSFHTVTPQNSSDLALTKEERSMLLKFRSLNPNDQAAIRSTIEQAYKQLSTTDHPDTTVNSHKFCEIIWYKILEFCDQNGIPSTLKYGVPLWAASYYCILEILDRKGLSEMVRTQFMVTTCECYKIPMSDRDAVKSILQFFDDTVSTITSYMDENPTFDHDMGAFTGDVPMSLKIALNNMQESGCEIACDCTLVFDFTLLVHSLRDIAMAIAV